MTFSLRAFVALLLGLSVSAEPGATAASQRAVAYPTKETDGRFLAASDKRDPRPHGDTILVEGVKPPPAGTQVVTRAQSDDAPEPEGTVSPDTLPIGMFVEYAAIPGETAAQVFDRIRMDGDLRWQLTGQCRTEPMVFYPDGLIASRELTERGPVTVTHETCTPEGTDWSCIRREGPPEAQGAVEDEYVLAFESGPAGMFALSLDSELYVYQPCHGPRGLVFPDETGPDGRPVWQSAMARGDGGPGLVLTPEGLTLPEGAPVPAPLPAPVQATGSFASPLPIGIFAERRGSHAEDLQDGFRRMLDDGETRNALLVSCLMQPTVFYPDGLVARRDTDSDAMGASSGFVYVTRQHDRCTAGAAGLMCSRHDGPPEAGAAASSTAAFDFVAGPNRLFALTDGEAPRFFQPCHGIGGLVSVAAAHQGNGQTFWPLQAARGDGGPGIAIAADGTVSIAAP